MGPRRTWPRRTLRTHAARARAFMPRLHWSLAIVANHARLKTASASSQHTLRTVSTSAINTRRRSSQAPTPSFDADTACIFFFDSLNMHDRDSICKNIRG